MARELRVGLTGATGTVGSAVADRLRSAGAVVRPVARGDWDLRRPLPDPARRILVDCDAVVHCAADVRLGAPAAHLWRVNADATAELVGALAAAPAPPRLVHLSSAFVDGVGHDNAYERSKRGAEEAVLTSGLDAAIVRPSLVIGRRGDGRIARFAGVYTVLRLLALGLFPALPVDDAARVDIVPVDLVAEATARALAAPPGGPPIVPVTAGAGAPTARWLFDTACDVIEARRGVPFERPKLVSPGDYRRLFHPLVLPELSPAQRVLLETLEIFFPYLEAGPAFASSMEVDPGDLRSAWRASVGHWAELADRGRSVGRSAWRPRRTAHA